VAVSDTANSETVHAAVAIIGNIEAALNQLRALLEPQSDERDPQDPRNKTPDGKLTERGVAVCYHLFDQDKTRYAVSHAMDISFGAATYRYNAWQKAGGKKRQKIVAG
jgi:hypothetical protein